jgi:predicted RNA-binding Zn ribbon-like protein
VAGDSASKEQQRSKTPAELVRLIGFLNSRPRGPSPDGLASIESATALLDRLGLGDVSLDAAGLERLRRLRAALTILADRERDGSGRSRAWDEVNYIAAQVPTTVRFLSDDESEVRPAGDGVDAVVGELLADLHGAVDSGRWARVRLCAYEPCSVAFYDATRSRTQRWHSYAVCGNRSNVAAYRRRTTSRSAKNAAS